MMSLPLRFVVYAPPELPCELFRAIGAHFQRSLGWPTTLRVELGTPDAERGPDPFAAGSADVGWMCAPWSVPLESLVLPATELAPVAPAFRSALAAASFPLRAVVLRRGLPWSLAREVARLLRELHVQPRVSRPMRAMGLMRFVSIGEGPLPIAIGSTAPHPGA